MANGSSTNDTESPCDFSKWGADTCYHKKEHFDSFGHPASLSCAVVGIFLNVVVIFVLRHAMKVRRSQGQIHLLALAFSDLASVIGFLNVGISGWLCDPCLPCYQLGRCYAALLVVFILWLLAVYTNRWLTLVITWLRARAIKNPFLQHANRDQSLCQSMTELIGYTLLFLGIGLAVSETVRYFLIQNGLSPSRIQHGFLIASACLGIVMMLSVATYILVKLRQRDDGAGNNISHAEADFQRLVALVAVVFGLTHVVLLVNLVVSGMLHIFVIGSVRLFVGPLICPSLGSLIRRFVCPLICQTRVKFREMKFPGLV